MDKTGVNIQLIVEECLRGNRKAERKLFEAYYGYGFSIAMRYASNREEAEEICADGFVKLFRHLDRYDPNYPFKPWLRRVFVHVAIDYFRKYEKHNNRHLLELDSVPLASEENDEALSHLGYEELMHCIQALPPAYRTVFMLYVVEGYKHHEIAEKLKISVGTSKSNLAKARKKLQELILYRDKSSIGQIGDGHKPQLT